MAKLKTWYRIIFWCVVFIVYVFFAARPVQKETVLSKKWLCSLETTYESSDVKDAVYPFNFGNRFGYMSSDGKFSVQRQKKGKIAISNELWAEFSGIENSIEIKDRFGKEIIKLPKTGGYPFFLDNKIFVMNRLQSSVSRFDEAGSELWRHDFGSIITCVDARSGFFLAGLLDGSVDLLDSSGATLFSQEPSGSRLASVYGCALDQKGQKVAIISGLDDQRFVLMEEAGGVWRITYHEFLGDGFNRPVRINFVDDGKKVAFEREDGIGIYDIAMRSTSLIRFSGRIKALESDGTGGLLFLIVEEAALSYKLIVIKDSRLFLAAPFKAASCFLERYGNELYIGGDSVLAAFSIVEK
ncbi:MAG: hypothetical protein Pg6A_05760 [Termitinemataceae bacterium]|nr:MAG: hypothetical protein Pg6A_05760 [Termitinemataceae bacterium]